MPIDSISRGKIASSLVELNGLAATAEDDDSYNQKLQAFRTQWDPLLNKASYNELVRMRELLAKEIPRVIFLLDEKIDPKMQASISNKPATSPLLHALALITKLNQATPFDVANAAVLVDRLQKVLKDTQKDFDAQVKFNLNTQLKLLSDKSYGSVQERTESSNEEIFSRDKLKTETDQLRTQILKMPTMTRAIEKNSNQPLKKAADPYGFVPGGGPKANTPASTPAAQAEPAPSPFTKATPVQAPAGRNQYGQSPAKKNPPAAAPIYGQTPTGPLLMPQAPTPAKVSETPQPVTIRPQYGLLSLINKRAAAGASPAREQSAAADGPEIANQLKAAAAKDKFADVKATSSEPLAPLPTAPTPKPPTK